MQSTPTLRLVCIVLALVLFAVSAYLSTTLGERLTRAAFVAVMLAWLL
jgi:hypothetical protein